MRADKDQVLALLFAAFEKHQYYCLKYPVGITLQPVLYLKEILHEIAVRVVQGPHKNAWKLKAEYRYYPRSRQGGRGPAFTLGRQRHLRQNWGETGLLLIPTMSCKYMFEFVFLSMIQETVCG